MTWAAEIVDKAEVNGMLVVTVRYSDGDRVITEKVQTQDPNGNWPVGDIQARIKSLSLVATKPITLGTVVEPAIEDLPSPEVREYGALVMRARHLKRAVDLGLKAAQSDFDAVLAQLEAGYKQEYESLF